MQEKKNIHTYIYIKKYTSPSFSSNILRSSYGINNTKKYLQQCKIAAPILHSITHIRQNIIINSIESMGRNKFQWDEKRKDPIKKLAKM
jgi:hypothetical protein